MLTGMSEDSLFLVEYKVISPHTILFSLLLERGLVSLYIIFFPWINLMCFNSLTFCCGIGKRVGKPEYFFFLDSKMWIGNVVDLMLLKYEVFKSKNILFRLKPQYTTISFKEVSTLFSHEESM